jgi:hypothetical protein
VNEQKEEGPVWPYVLFSYVANFLLLKYYLFELIAANDGYRQARGLCAFLLLLSPVSWPFEMLGIIMANLFSFLCNLF